VSRKNEDEVSGRTENNRVVNFPAGKSVIGKFVEVRITAAYPNSLRGELIE
ncbi:MAG TPA: TRAM domain-containing protein, partial [Gammaproteobacteria bacterium]